MTTSISEKTAALELLDASKGFDAIFSDDIQGSIASLELGSSAFHSLGLGVAIFLQAALGLEKELMAESAKKLGEAERKAREHAKAVKAGGASEIAGDFPLGMEWDIVIADAVVLGGLTQALNETYAGYLQAIYALNSAHSKFTKLYQLAFPNGLDGNEIPSPSRISHLPGSGLLSRFSSPWSTPKGGTPGSQTPVEKDPALKEFITAGTLFGFGIFSLVVSLLPPTVRNVAGWLGYKSDRKLAIRALHAASDKKDVHSIFAALTLMTHYGMVLFMSGWQGDRSGLIKSYRDSIAPVMEKYPTGALWLLNQAKLEKYEYQIDMAISILESALAPDRPTHFRQADALILFEMAWNLLAETRYTEAGNAFMRMSTVNSWSPATYHFIAAGCFMAANDLDRAQELLDKVPSLLDKKKIGGKDLPTEVYVRKKITYYQEKQARLNGDPSRYVESMKISGAEEMGIFWSAQEFTSRQAAERRIAHWLTLRPPSRVNSTSVSTSDTNDTTDFKELDTPQELMLRDILLGITHRTTSRFKECREYLTAALELKDQLTGSWMVPVALSELAVLELHEQEAHSEPKDSSSWTKALNAATAWLDQASNLAYNAELSNRLDIRMNLLREEITTKRNML